jgi:hypothetical protein
LYTEAANCEQSERQSRGVGLRIDQVGMAARQVVVRPGVLAVVGRSLLRLGDDPLALGAGLRGLLLLALAHLLVRGQTALGPRERGGVAIGRVHDEPLLGRSDRTGLHPLQRVVSSPSR